MIGRSSGATLRPLEAPAGTISELRLPAASPRIRSGSTAGLGSCMVAVSAARWPATGEHMLVWAAMVGAVIGWLWAELEGWGAVPGAVLGWLAGLGLRSVVRAEIERTFARLQADALGVAPPPREPAAWSPPRDVPLASEERGSPVARPEAPIALPPETRELPPSTIPLPPTEPGPIELAFAAARLWLLGGNTIVRVGLVILFVGLSFLARYAAAAGLFPVELRLALVAAAGAALLLVGFRTRTRRPAFGLALQGAGVGVVYLTLFGAVRLVPGFPVPAAFAVMVLVCAFGCALALLQRSQALAVTAFAGGYATPLLLSDGTGAIAGLFGYFTLLNVAVLFIASRRAWRVLNLLGFFATFGVASAWLLASYRPADFVVAQAFVAASVAIYLAAAVLFARRSPGRLGAVVDTTLLFGPALVGFGDEVALVGDLKFGSAFAALAFAALYLLVATVATRRDAARFRVLHEAMLAIGIGFVTLAVPLALGARWTSAAWALEGAGAVWVGVRQARWLPRASGLALQAVAAAVLLAATDANVAPLPFANPAFGGGVLVAAALLATAWLLRVPASAETPMGRRFVRVEALLAYPLFLAGFAFGWLALFWEIERLAPPATTADLATPVLGVGLRLLLPMLAYIGLAGAWRWLGKRTAWAVATWPSYATLAALVIGFVAAESADRRVLSIPDWAVWAAAIGLHLWLLHRNDRDAEDARPGPLLAATHVGGVWLGAAMVADVVWSGVDRADLWRTSWASVVFLASVTAVLLGLTAWAGRALARDARRWPLDRHAAAYAWVAAAPIAALVFLGTLATALAASGETSPIPYLPLLNPVDLSLALGLAALALWRRTLLKAADRPPAMRALSAPAVTAGFAALAFVALNTVWLRFAHHMLGLAWDPDALLADTVVQTGLAILWTAVALLLMIHAHRAARRARWLAGAGLLGLTVLKLVFVDLDTSGGAARIVAFIGVGVLMLVVGYLAPLPPRRAEAAA